MLSNFKPLIKYTIIGGSSVILASCAWMKPADKRISESRNKISANFQRELQRQQNVSNQGKLDITWQQGLNKMYESNPDLIQADFRIADAKLNKNQIWKNMTPSLSVGLSDSFTIDNAGDAFSNSFLRVNSFIALGNLLTLPNDLYASKLTYIGTELSAENSMRQQVIVLYNLFQEQRLLEIQKKAIDIEGELLQGTTDLDGAEVITMKLRHKQSLETWINSEKAWKVKVGDFFMQGYDSINLKEAGIPDIIYDPEELDFTDTSRWGLLQLNLLALEDIAEKGNFLDTYLRYLPRANLSVSAPSLFSNTSNENFDPGLTRLNPSLNWALDSRGSISRQLDRLKRETPLKQWDKDKRQREEIKKLIEGKEALKEIQMELIKLKKVMASYIDIVSSGLIEDPEKAIQTMRMLREREVTLLVKEIEICSSFWLIDEQRWKPITKKWLATRIDRTKARKAAQDTNLKTLLKN